MKKDKYSYVWLLEIAKIYKRMGDKQKALEYAKKAINLDYGNKKVNEFINNLY